MTAKLSKEKAGFTSSTKKIQNLNKDKDKNGKN